jgi:DNA-binding HxlR family transcriptional regulator
MWIECEANSANSQQGRQKRVAVRPDAESAEECLAQLAINLIQGKWKTRILSRLQHGPVRLGELRRIFPEASKKMLTQHLREMEKDRLVVRKDPSGKLRHVEYLLSDSLGFAVLHLIGTLTKWGREYLPYEGTHAAHPCCTATANRLRRPCSPVPKTAQAPQASASSTALSSPQPAT